MPYKTSSLRLSGGIPDLGFFSLSIVVLVSLLVVEVGKDTSLWGNDGLMLLSILSCATCEGASQIRWHEDSIMGMVKWGASNLAGYTIYWIDLINPIRYI